MALSVFERAALCDFPDELTIEEAARWMTASGDDRNGEAKFRDACSFLLELVKRDSLSPVRSEEKEWGRPYLHIFSAPNLFGGGETSTPIARNNSTSPITKKLLTTVHYVTPLQLCHIKEAAERAEYWGPCVKSLVGDAMPEEKSKEKLQGIENPPPPPLGELGPRKRRHDAEIFAKELHKKGINPLKLQCLRDSLNDVLQHAYPSFNRVRPDTFEKDIRGILGCAKQCGKREHRASRDVEFWERAGFDLEAIRNKGAVWVPGQVKKTA